MQATQSLKQRTIEAKFIATIVCAVALTVFAISNSMPVSNVVLVLLSSVILISQLFLYRSYRRLKLREHRFHQVGRKLTQLKVERSKEEALALKISNHINSTNCKVPDHAHIWQKPLQSFSGDLALAYESPCGIKYTLLADLTGHGIAAAISAAPVASIFKATARNCLGVGEMITELNNRLQELLPSGFFCCAAIVLDNNGVVTACNAGLPDILITNDKGELVNSVTSTQLPLGIEHMSAQDVELFTCEYQQRHQLYVYTDGLIETVSANDEVFDVDVLTSLVASKTDRTGRLGKITERFESFSKGSAFNDDISIVEVMIR